MIRSTKCRILRISSVSIDPVHCSIEKLNVLRDSFERDPQNTLMGLLPHARQHCRTVRGPIHQQVRHSGFREFPDLIGLPARFEWAAGLAGSVENCTTKTRS
jgi:hypothetical protein